MSWLDFDRSRQIETSGLRLFGILHHRSADQSSPIAADSAPHERNDAERRKTNDSSVGGGDFWLDFSGLPTKNHGTSPQSVWSDVLAEVHMFPHVRRHPRLVALVSGDPQAAEQLSPLVYEALRKLAARKMTQEKSRQTLGKALYTS